MRARACRNRRRDRLGGHGQARQGLRELLLELEQRAVRYQNQVAAMLDVLGKRCTDVRIAQQELRSSIALCLPGLPKIRCSRGSKLRLIAMTCRR